MISSLKDFMPPVIFKVYRALRPRKYGWIGNYSTWEEAKKACTGYDSEVIVEKVRTALLRVKTGEVAYERDGVVFDEPKYTWPIVSSILLAYYNNQTMNVLDYGGSLGSTYFQHKKIFNRFNNLRWNIVEQAKFVEIGNKDFQSDHLRFYYSVEDCFAETTPNILLLGSVLQYIEKPYELLSQLFSYNFDYIIIDRTPFDNNDQHRITVQNVDPSIYEASYPSHLFSENDLLSYLGGSRYKVMAQYKPDGESIEGLNLKGLILHLNNDKQGI